MPRFRFRPPRVTRNTILFAAGLAGLAYVTVWGGNTEKPTLIIAFLGMMGTPIFLRSDEQRQEEADDATSDDPLTRLLSGLPRMPTVTPPESPPQPVPLPPAPGGTATLAPPADDPFDEPPPPPDPGGYP